MRQQILQRDRLAKSVGDFEVKVIVNVAIQIQLALLVQLHRGGPGKELRYRTWPKQCLFRRDGCLLRHVGETIAFRKQDPSILHDRDGSAGDVFSLKLQRQDAVKESGEIGGSQLGRGWTSYY